MLFLIALISVAVFIYVCHNLLKKNPYIFYGIAVILTVATVFIDFTGLPSWINKYVLGLFTKGVLGTAMFVFVMYAGALKNGTTIVKVLMKIRGELSITAAMLVLAHNITYGKVYFVALFSKPESMPANRLVAAIISVILITLMVILTITSFPSIRKKMKAKNWKKLQRSAYIFYGLTYVHIMLINVPLAKAGRDEYLLNVIVYSLVFVNYGVMRVRKAVMRKNSGKAGVTKTIVIAMMGIIVVMPALAVSISGYVETNRVEDSGDVLNDKEAVTESISMESTINTNEGMNEIVLENSTERTSEVATKVPDSSIIETESQVEAITASPIITPTTVSTMPAPTVARNYKADGTYSASARCTDDFDFDYNITVSIVIAGDKITEVNVTSDDTEDNSYYIERAAKLTSKIVVAQSADGIDAMSQATYSSKAILSAAKAAIASAK